MLARALLPSSFFAALIAAGCGPVAAPAAQPLSSRATQAIINGTQCSEQTDPTAMAIIVDGTIDLSDFGQPPTDFVQPICTGTLIAPDVVLTAAHCTDATLLSGGFGTVTRADYYVTFQSDLSALAESQSATPPPVPEGAVPVRELVHHEQFNINDLNSVNGPGEFHDVALLFLSTSIAGIEPELVIQPDEAAAMTQGAPVEIAGWGQQTVTQGGPFSPPPPGTVGIKVCGPSTINELGTAEMQIGGDSSTVRKCHGDSGGPTYLDVGGDHAKTRRVIGITSHAYDQQDCNKGGVDTRVDVHTTWIDDKMSARCADGSRVWCDVPGIIPPAFFDPPPSDGNAHGVGADDPAVKKGCASTPASSLGVLALALGALRRRRR